MMNFLHFVPIWVWAVLAILLTVGIIASRDRVAPLWIYWLLPFLALLGFRSAAGLHAGFMVWPAFLVALALGAYGGYRLQTRWIVERLGDRVRVRGEWFTLATMLVLFSSNFVLGIVRVLLPETLTSPLFFIPYVLVIGLASGSFAGRSLRVLRV